MEPVEMEKKSILFGYLRKILIATAGCAIVGLGTVLMLQSKLGLNSWGILHQGISLHTPLTFGQASQALGFAILMVCMAFRVYPGVGTFINMYFCGLFMDLFKRAEIPIPGMLCARAGYLVMGVVLLAFGMYVYISQGLGAGPKDGLMLLLHRVTRMDIAVVRTGMELTAVGIGFLLGGEFGVGTILGAAALGPVLRTFYRLFHYYPNETRQENILETFHTVCRLMGGKA